MLLLDTFGNSTIGISLRIKLPDDLIIRYCFLEVLLKIKFCKTLCLLELSFFVSMGSYWVRIITEHEHFYVKKMT